MNLTHVRAGVRRLVLVSVSTVLAAASLSLTSVTPAVAAAGYIDVPNAVAYDDCRYVPVRWSVDTARALEGWSMTVSAYDPRGVEDASAFLYSDANPTSGSTGTTDDGLLFCGFELPGTWRVVADVDYYDGGASERFTDTFVVRRPMSRATIAAHDYSATYGQRIRFSSKVTGEFPRGYFALPYEPVRIQKRTPSGWRTAATTYTDGKGIARFSLVWRHAARVAVRVVAVPGTPYAGAVSRTITIT